MTRSDRCRQFIQKTSSGYSMVLTGKAGFILSSILSFYSVVGDWILSYLMRAISFKLTSTSQTFYSHLFTTLTQNPWEVVIAQGLFMILTIWMVLRGVKNGIEKASKWMLLILFIFFIVLAIRSIILDEAFEGIKFMFVPYWSYLTGKTFLLAMGQSQSYFF